MASIRAATRSEWRTGEPSNSSRTVGYCTVLKNHTSARFAHNSRSRFCTRGQHCQPGRHVVKKLVRDSCVPAFVGGVRDDTNVGGLQELQGVRIGNSTLKPDRFLFQP